MAAKRAPDGPRLTERAASCPACGTVDLVVVGPEAPLVEGVADGLRSMDSPLGPPGGGADGGLQALHEESRARERDPTSRFEVFDDADQATDYIRPSPAPCVVKADGLCAGKGVSVAARARAKPKGGSLDALRPAFGTAGRTVVRGSRRGAEASVHAICDGTHYFLLPPCKTTNGSAKGTRSEHGGMGAYGPAPLVTPALRSVDRRARGDRTRNVVPWRAAAHRSAERSLRGPGSSRPTATPHVLEYNVRFGDSGDRSAHGAARRRTSPERSAERRQRPRSTRPQPTPRSAPRAPSPSCSRPGSSTPAKAPKRRRRSSKVSTRRPTHSRAFGVLHAGTRRDGDRVVTAGGRVLVVTASADTLPAARDVAYEGVRAIQFEGMQVRGDIASRALG